jgi:hypothetical protein
MQLALRSYAITGVAVVGAGLVAITPVAPSVPDIPVQSPGVQLASAADLGDLAGLFSVADAADSTPTTLGGLIDAGLQQVETVVLQDGIALGYIDYGLLSQLATGLDDLGATALGADVLTLADDAISTQWTAGVTTDFNDLIALVNALGLNSISLGAAAAADVADSTATTLGGLIDAGIQQLETSVLDGEVELGYVEYGVLTQLATGLDDLGATTLGADVTTLANDAIDTQGVEASTTAFFTDLTTLVNDLGLNSISLGGADAASLGADLAPNLADTFATLF